MSRSYGGKEDLVRIVGFLSEVAFVLTSGVTVVSLPALFTQYMEI
jgi:hypothetical protein